jgi:hypothetical protein
MSHTIFHQAFAIMKARLPKRISNFARNTATAFLTPILFSYRTGHFLSSLQMAAISKKGEPLPWYTYPSIDFLKNRPYDNKIVLEFGGGQSTLWWAQRAKSVVTLEGDLAWFDRIKHYMPGNVDLNYVSMENSLINVECVEETIRSKPHTHYDIIIIDGLYRHEMIPIALRVMAQDGMIVCDNAEGYGIYEGFKDSDLKRVDFFGNAPGVILPHATSIFFRPSSFAFNSAHPIPIIASE